MNHTEGYTINGERFAGLQIPPNEVFHEITSTVPYIHLKHLNNIIVYIHGNFRSTLENGKNEKV